MVLLPREVLVQASRGSPWSLIGNGRGGAAYTEFEKTPHSLASPIASALRSNRSCTMRFGRTCGLSGSAFAYFEQAGVHAERKQT
jgi:hypothetical protein